MFKVGTGGTGAFTGNSFQVAMGGTARACNVYWRTAQGATVTDSIFRGTLLSGGRLHYDQRKLFRARFRDDRRDGN